MTHRIDRSWPGTLVLFVAAALLLCSCAGSGGGSTPRPSPASGSPQSRPSAAPQIRCLKISDVDAKQILGIPGPFSTSGNAKYPCPAFWDSPVQWEQGEGPDSLHGQLSDAAVTLEYIDFPDRPAAMEEYQALSEAASRNQVDKFGVTRRVVSPIDSSGDAEAFLDLPEPSLLSNAYGSQLASSVVGRCGVRLLRLNASKDTFYSATMDGHDPSEENIVQRSRLPIVVQRELSTAYTLLGDAVCAGDNPPSILIGPYSRP